jgi:hypothetical protein
MARATNTTAPVIKEAPIRRAIAVTADLTAHRGSHRFGGAAGVPYQRADGGSASSASRSAGHTRLTYGGGGSCGRSSTTPPPAGTAFLSYHAYLSGSGNP